MSLDDWLFSDADVGRAQKVLRPKVQGSMVKLRCTLDVANTSSLPLVSGLRPSRQHSRSMKSRRCRCSWSFRPLRCASSVPSFRARRSWMKLWGILRATSMTSSMPRPCASSFSRCLPSNTTKRATALHADNEKSESPNGGIQWLVEYYHAGQPGEKGLG